MLRTWWARGRILEGVFNYSERYGILRGGTGGEEAGVASGRKRESGEMSIWDCHV